MKGSLANLAVHPATGLAAAVKNRLKPLQYRHLHQSDPNHKGV
jgi:hypothetical protein